MTLASALAASIVFLGAAGVSTMAPSPVASAAGGSSSVGGGGGPSSGGGGTGFQVHVDVTAHRYHDSNSGRPEWRYVPIVSSDAARYGSLGAEPRDTALGGWSSWKWFVEVPNMMDPRSKTYASAGDFNDPPTASSPVIIDGVNKWQGFPGSKADTNSHVYANGMTSAQMYNTCGQQALDRSMRNTDDGGTVPVPSYAVAVWWAYSNNNPMGSAGTGSATAATKKQAVDLMEWFRSAALASGNVVRVAPGVYRTQASYYANPGTNGRIGSFSITVTGQTPEDKALLDAADPAGQKVTTLGGHRVIPTIVNEIADLAQTSVNKLGSGDAWSATCVALNEHEPNVPVPTYGLDVATTASAPTSATGSASDTIHSRLAANSAYTDPRTITAYTKLAYTSPESVKKSTGEKSKAITSVGNTVMPGFSPSDVDPNFKRWEPGTYCFTARVPVQDLMAKAVQTTCPDPAETFTIDPVPTTKTVAAPGTTTPLAPGEVLAANQAYDARVVAPSNGYSSSMTIFEIINTDQVHVGTAAADEASKVTVFGPDGKPVAAVVTIDRSVAGEVTVTARVKPGGKAGDYVMVVPTYSLATGADYTIEDGSKVCYLDDLSVCMDGNSEQVDKVTPTPNKAWVLNSADAHTADDVGWTNKIAADDEVFLPTDGVGVVVNGSIPAGLIDTLTDYVIGDDWTKNAAYVDFSDQSRVRVYLEQPDGSYEDVTSQFEIAVDTVSHTTAAIAGSDFLSATKGLANALRVKLYLGGEFLPAGEYPAGTPTDGTLVEVRNDGYETWNTETAPTNQPSVFTRLPTPAGGNKLVEAGGSIVTKSGVWPAVAGVGLMVLAAGAVATGSHLRKN